MAVIAPIVSTFDNAGVRKATKAFDKLQGAAKASFGKIAGAASKRKLDPSVLRATRR